MAAHTPPSTTSSAVASDLASTPYSRRFFLSFALGFLVLSLGWLGGVKAQLGVPTPSSRWVFDDYQFKTAQTQASVGSRVLIVAGSNALFGVDSALIADYWKRPTFNLAVNAGLGLPYILAHAQRQIRSGDIVFMPLEYALMLDTGAPNAQVIDYVMARDLDHWRSLSRWEQLRFAFYASPVRVLQGLKHPADPAITQGTYGAHRLNALGDQTLTEVGNRRAEDWAAVQRASEPKSAWHYGQRARNERGAWQQLADFAGWAKQQGACVIMTPTALLHHASYDTDPIERAFYQGLPQRIEALGIPYLGKPRDFMYPADQFFDTDHHLIASARTRHTQALIRAMQGRPDLCQTQTSSKSG